MKAAERHLQPAPEPAAEPLAVVLWERTANERVVVVKPEDGVAWEIAYHLREEQVALTAAERDLRGKRALITKLQADEEAERQRARDNFTGRETIALAFERWLAGRRERTGNPKLRAKLTPERFDMAMARMTRDNYEAAAILMAAEGVARNPYIVDGKAQDDWKTAMQSGEQVERYANRCPREIRRAITTDDRGGQDTLL